MTLFPPLRAAWLNGWILLVIYGVVFGVVVKSFPQDVVARLYDKSHWTRTQRRLTLVAKILSSILLVLLAFSPLQIGRPVFVAGAVLSAVGLIGLVVALFNFKDAQPGQPATNGLYRLSRNPQWVALVIMFAGNCLAVGSWAALSLFALVTVFYHFRILGEERSCLELYGTPYRDYLGQVPRYLLLR